MLSRIRPRLANVRVTPRAGTLTAVAATALVAVALAANWRVALLAAIAAAIIALTRMRYSPIVAVTTVAVLALLAVTGRAPGSDDRAVVSLSPTTRHCAAVSHLSDIRARGTSCARAREVLRAARTGATPPGGYACTHGARRIVCRRGHVLVSARR